MKKNPFAIIVIVLIIVILAVIVVLAKNSTKTNETGRTPELEAFNTCLKDKGAKFYGASWCPHCAAQKKLLGYSKLETPPAYIECSPVAGSPLLPICEAAKIESFPTWDFADGTRLTGETPLQTLAEKTSCPLNATSTDASLETGGASSATTTTK